MKKQDQIQKITVENFSFQWECPCCGKIYNSDTGISINEFAEDLYRDGVRFKVMKYMQGVFCKECYEDPEVQNSTL